MHLLPTVIYTWAKGALCLTSKFYLISMASTIQYWMHILQDVHFRSLIFATFASICIASMGHFFIQASQPIHLSLLTITFIENSYSGFGKPMLSDTSFIAFNANSANSLNGINSSMDHIAFLSAPAAKRVSFIRLVIDFTLTLWTFLSG